MSGLKKAAAILFTVWIVAITARYVQTVLKSVANPFNPGNDTQWLIIWLAAVAGIALFLIACAGALRILVKLTIGAMIALSIVSGVWAAALLTGWFLIVVYAWGMWLLRLAGVEPEDRIDSLALAIPLGLVIPAITGFVLACFHLLKPSSVWILIIALTAFQWRTITGLRRRGIEFRKTSFEQAFPLAIILPVVLLNFVWAVAPEIGFDAGNYHLFAPKVYLASGGFVSLPYLFMFYLAHLNEMLYTFAVAMHGPAAAKLLSFAASLIAASSAYALGREVFDARVGSWAAAGFYTMPMVSWLAGTAYTDNFIAMILAAAILAFVKWHKQPASTGWLYTASALAGIAIAGKMNAALGVPVLIAALCWNVRRLSVWRVAVCLGLIAAVAAPWYTVSYYFTGNPFLPMLNGLFKSSMWEQRNSVMNSSAFGIGTSFSSLLRLPFRLVFNTELFGEASPRGGAGIGLLIAFPFGVFLLSRGRQAAGMLVAALAVYFLLWSFSMQYCRYFVHILPLVYVLAAGVVFHFGVRGSAGVARLVCMAVAFVMQFAVAPVQYWNIPERYPVNVALGLENREHFLDRAMGGYTAAMHLNGLLNKDDRVIGAGVEQIRYYLNAPLETLAQSTLHTATRALVGARPDEALLKEMRSYGFTYILASKDSLRDPSDQAPYLKAEFLSRFATLEYSDASAALYRLN